MFWDLVPKDVIGKLAVLSSADFDREWERKKHKMEKASRRPWTEYENSARTMQLRENALGEFWEIFVDDRRFYRNTCFKHATVQSKAVFSFASNAIERNTLK